MSSASQGKTAPRQIGLQLTFFAIAIALCGLYLHAVYVTNDLRSIRESLEPYPRSPVHVPVPPSQPKQSDDLPDIFIYRRTKKTGSSAMLDALLRTLEPHGYVPVYIGGEQANELVRAESIRPHPRRLFIAQHNIVSKSTDPHRRAIIADTFRDGYEQMTSYCRFSKGIKECGAELIECLESDYAQEQKRYRWARRTEEDVDTYIDLPLSSAHPALSTTVLRRVFPNATLELDHYNVANSTCPEIPELRKVYNKRYQPLEKQIKALRKRMLMLAGYPTEVNVAMQENITLAEIIDAAEASEKLKYNIRESQTTTEENAKSHSQVLRELRIWTKTDNGSVAVINKFKSS